MPQYGAKINNRPKVVRYAETHRYVAFKEMSIIWPSDRFIFGNADSQVSIPAMT
jgi:hypothetical protein